MITRLGTYAQIKGSSYLLPCTLATTENIVLSGASNEESQVYIDNEAVLEGDRVLVKDQDNESENGIYIVSFGTWSRAIDMSTQDDLIRGQQVYIRDGNINRRKVYRVSVNDFGDEIAFQENLFINPRPYYLIGSEYEIDSGDTDKWLLAEDAISTIITFSTDPPLPTNSEFIITQLSEGQVTIDPGEYEVYSPTGTYTTRTQFSTIFIKYFAEGVMILGGDLT
jgi:hypothetical protein